MTTILFVDDHSDLATVFSRMLDRRGYYTTPATSVEEGLDSAHTVKYDLVICDIVFEGKSGYQFLSEFRKFSDAPTIAISGVLDHLERTLAAGFTSFLQKPLLLDTLVLAIEQALPVKPKTLNHATG